MRKLMLLIFFGMGISGFAVGQTLDRSIISPNGGSNTAGSISLDWSVGEIAIESIHSNTKLFTQGFHQTTLIVKKVELVPLELAVAARTSQIETFVRPNPVASQLNVNISGASHPELEILIFDAAGNQVMKRKVGIGISTIHIDVEKFASGIYILKVISANQVVDTYRIAKI